MIDIGHSQHSIIDSSPLPVQQPTTDMFNLSTQAIIAEHNRVAGLYLYNAQMGESRIGGYLTVVSLSIGGLLGLSQLNIDAHATIELAIAVLGGISVLGLVTFQRLIERRILGTELLRAVNRLHAYFVRNDPVLEPYFFWPPCDDLPRFRTATAFNGLMGLIAALDSIFVGIMAALTLYFVWPAGGLAVDTVVALVVMAAAWLTHHRYQVKRLESAEEAAKEIVRFPSSTKHGNV